MKKKIILIVLLAFSATIVSAKGVGLNLDIGGQYCNHELHTRGSSNNGTYRHSIYGQHLGGLNLGIEYKLNRSWAFFAETIFSIKNNGFVNDSLVGFGYNFKLPKGFGAFFGGGFAFGGNVNIGSSYTTEFAYVGGGLKGEVSYMFSGMFGAYVGATLNLYGIPTLTTRTGSYTTKTNPSEDMAKSIDLKLGLRIKL